MKKILAIGASNSQKSINRKLAYWAASQVKDAEIADVDLNDYEMPLYGIDLENQSGIPEAARRFKEMVNGCDGIVLSFAEHNGSFSVAFKNIYDWISRLGKPIWSDKPMFIMATSPGMRGGRSVLETAEKILPHRGAKVCAVYSLPSFHDHFSDGITDAALLQDFEIQLEKFANTL